MLEVYDMFNRAKSAEQFCIKLDFLVYTLDT